MSVLKNYINDSFGEWLALVGPTGCGKTYAAAALMLEILREAPNRCKRLTAGFVPWLRVAPRLRNPDTTDEAMGDILRHDAILLDDVGLEHRGDGTWLASIADMLFRACCEQEKILFMTSNLGMEDFLEWLGAPNVSRFRERGMIVAVTGTDLRLQQRRRNEWRDDDDV